MFRSVIKRRPALQKYPCLPWVSLSFTLQFEISIKVSENVTVKVYDRILMFQRIELFAFSNDQNTQVIYSYHSTFYYLLYFFMKNYLAKKYFSKNQFKDATKMSDDKSYVLEILNESTLPHYSFHKLQM